VLCSQVWNHRRVVFYHLIHFILYHTLYCVANGSSYLELIASLALALVLSRATLALLAVNSTRAGSDTPATM
jgi:hypothetical protein